ncbi:peptidoglycan endopeptidase [Sphingomonas naphthae]|uniref:Peptidoglycan endopeptidase n=1 Tax=Sphingomonas naphthae TaxID=1813468 RepID=A0ABY7TKC7_9SPHN|nr:peptidoglycan endopeptidase [Sphingomonas naphthae]WCT73682.1 peptidoglycan endopeptidase [Sphingomonas naphthae]
MRGDVVARARGCVGARFRVHGRDPAFGLDCVGLVGIAFARTGLPADYAVRGGSAPAVAAAIGRAGLVAAGGDAAGDLLLLDCGAGQLHLAVGTGAGFVHADAKLRRVVEVPGRPAWPLLGAWAEAG